MKEAIVKMTSDHIKVKGGEYVQDLVRCKDCRWHNDERGFCEHYRNTGLKAVAEDNDFCSDGEVRDEFHR